MGMFLFSCGSGWFLLSCRWEWVAFILMLRGLSSFYFDVDRSGWFLLTLVGAGGFTHVGGSG